jgi:hypothetical protein
MDDKRQLFLSCDCVASCNGFLFTYFADDDPLENLIYVAPFVQVGFGHWPFLHRAKHAWSVLRRNMAHEDHLILDKEAAQRLVVFLGEFLARLEK